MHILRQTFTAIVLCSFAAGTLANNDAREPERSPAFVSDNSTQTYRVAIIDRFFPPIDGFATSDDRRIGIQMYGLLDLDRDRKPEPFYHGDIVRMIAANPNVSFFNYPMRNGATPMNEILANLKKIRQRLSIQPLDALVLSWESSTLISAFEKPLHLEHAKHYQNIVRDWGKGDPSWRATYAIIKELEGLVKDGVSVYTIAGNGGSGMVNTFSFAEGVITVGATEEELKYFVSDNAFVDTHEQAAYLINRIDDELGNPIGYDIDGDHCADIPLQRLSGYFSKTTGAELPKQAWKHIKGSSFAAPMALKKAIMKLTNSSEDSYVCHTQPQLLANF